MSRLFQPKNKELANVKVVSTDYYNKDRSKLKLIGKIKRGETAFVTTTKSKKTGVSKFVTDTSSLTKKSKNEVVKFFSDDKNMKRDTLYLVVDKKKK